MTRSRPRPHERSVSRVSSRRSRSQAVFRSLRNAGSVLTGDSASDEDTFHLRRYRRIAPRIDGLADFESLRSVTLTAQRRCSRAAEAQVPSLRLPVGAHNFDNQEGVWVNEPPGDNLSADLNRFRFVVHIVRTVMGNDRGGYHHCQTEAYNYEWS